MTKASKITATQIAEGDRITVTLSVATAHCAIGTNSITGEVTKTTEKAIQITTYVDQRIVWLPKKALVKGNYNNKINIFSIAKWFHPDIQHWKAANVNVLAA